MKILVTYATWTGATHEVADAIADVLRATGAAVDVRKAGAVKKLDGYEAIVMGTSAHMGKVPREAVGFARRNKSALSRLPVAEFIVCLTMREDTPERRATAQGYLDQINTAAPDLKPVATGMFAGAVLQGTEDARKLNPIARSIAMKMVKNVPDSRDWDAIRAWAGELPDRLNVAA